MDEQDRNYIAMFDDPFDRAYKTAQAYNYQKHEEALITNVTQEEAFKNAQQLIMSEEMAKLKAEKKKAKKKQQKEKKKVEKINNTNNNNNDEKKPIENSTIPLNSVVSIKPDETTAVEQIKDENLESPDQEVDEFFDINAAFVKVSVKQNKNATVNKTSSHKPNKANLSLDPMSMPLPKFVKPKANQMNHNIAETFGIKSFHLVLKDSNFDQAINYLTQAISLDPNDVRHFLNRSYCYLRLGNYTSALDDARFARENAVLMEDLAKAVAREGQALRGLNQYLEAEKCFEEALKLGQRTEWLLGELIQTRTLQLTNMGFSQTAALQALQQCSTVADAVTLLISGTISNPESKSNVSQSEIEDCDGNELYFSDDDQSSSTILLSKLVSALTDKFCYFENSQSQFVSSKAQKYSSNFETTLENEFFVESRSRSSSIHSNSSVQRGVTSNVKNISSISKTKFTKVTPNSSNLLSVWVGNVDDSITDYKLRKLFSKFGTINIRRIPNKNYVFINFDSKQAASKVLNSKTNFEINGIKLSVKPTQGSFGKK